MFFNITTLYFKSDNFDEFRETGFLKMVNIVFLRYVFGTVPERSESLVIQKSSLKRTLRMKGIGCMKKAFKNGSDI